MTVGFIGGKFLPLHLGYVYAIIHASTMVDELYVVLSHSKKRDTELFSESKMEYIPPQVRLRWLSQITRDMPQVKVISIEDDHGNDDYNWAEGAELIKGEIGKQIDYVFSSEYEYGEIFQELYPNSKHVLIDPERHSVSISATKIRQEGVFNHWEFIPDVVRPYFVKKIVIVGTESCGKSTLTRNLAKLYNTTYVSEYGRTVCEELGGCDGVIAKEDYHKIAYGHKMEEYKAIEKANKLVFIDTEAIVTQFYSNLYNQEHQPVLDEMAKLQDYDLWLFLEPDVKWVDDGLRVHGEEAMRVHNNESLKELLDNQKITYNILSGDYHRRLISAVELIEDLL
ncbi:multifunctional transcriptional regulator/nicotinamide-nucleotide adenylyltransferase/ribosylnicotinamide kinase NadR [Metabacillus halosaccharovorans]|uniref:multifunctional transcriptional regulator/nicotinamide-nucleotide adenylyltransferase/ribosylnicotinamide kinase NadR n=1 Tax=Metabacillus halosaccharovorans TaxID=930124 RepID=UPI00203E22F2|nr:multifunctional transcriptional regulator/nicotinamide-nucleotide adenylyltransferase/ribosylnicotinamide kinase NadR [Metabacillus halosaccharovorans]MCM3442571.1 multifunctional transcriptional regulator/nicotinamide-nucleotide adenylyltransferase/ribosylnicotinamide kinase NadR [Metabacillus halosaccharovorans]